MRKGLMFILIVMCSSCSAQNDLVTVKYPTKGNPTFYLDVPKGYAFKWIRGGHGEDEHQYFYNDSSFIYITEFSGGGPNYNNIANLPDSIKNLRLQNEEIAREANKLTDKNAVKILPDTFELTGVDSESYFWKDVKLGKFSAGYVNVPPDKKEQYDKALATLRRKKK
jgi:hypothetical protein